MLFVVMYNMPTLNKIYLLTIIFEGFILASPWSREYILKQSPRE